MDSFKVTDTEMSANFQIYSSDTQAKKKIIIRLIMEHVWECYYRKCMGMFPIIVNYSALNNSI